MRAAVLVGAVCLVPAAPAHALSCAATPGYHAPARDVAASGDFHGRFHGAVVGVVTAYEDKPLREPVIVVAVEQSFGPALGDETRILGSHWSGPLEVGRRYFIPYWVSQGTRQVVLCGDGPELVAGPLPSPSPAPLRAQPRSVDGPTWPPVLAGALVVAGVALLVVLGRRRGSTEG